MFLLRGVCPEDILQVSRVFLLGLLPKSGVIIDWVGSGNFFIKSFNVGMFSPYLS